MKKFKISRVLLSHTLNMMYLILNKKTSYVSAYHKGMMKKNSLVFHKALFFIMPFVKLRTEWWSMLMPA